ncbi:NADH dehydrogenase [ubiquinone] 1 alpha subcomplex subunit 11 [Carcharodon carcharias]|uniref:NADH dehydrogenase [ubiquinone] 1 alpha subcomplex subunit 11 n=1 Tax=Carcharodon carcharias TaxID=13397 RepID=UPI001B7D924D|nr:NADH dehydrogenase [ubiquinone] 1 alpha subcomplex subunit 11 [Carcharodon carcharias]
MGYWDSADGEECFSKTWETTRAGAGLGLVGSAYHIVALPPTNAVEALQRATNGTLTMAALGAIFGVTTCLTAQIRETENDPLNYFIGGCASGIFLGVRAHSYMTGTSACLGLGVIAALTKMGKMEGWRLAGPPKL